MSVEYSISSTLLPVVSIKLQQGQKIYSSSGGMSWMTQHVQMQTNSGGGLGKMFRRALTGESLFIVDYFVNDGDGEIAFSSEFPARSLCST